MDDRQRDEEESLVEGLDALPGEAFKLPESSDDFRRSLLVRTERVVGARRARRPWLALAAVAIAYVGGITTALLVREPGVPKHGERIAAVETPRDPKDLMRRSETAAPPEQRRLLTRAGDLYLSERYDVEMALRCYSRALETMPDSERGLVKTSDSWLLAALKDSRKR